MNETIFCDGAIVELQGEEALQLLELDNQYAKYRVIGFEQLRIFITDYRMGGVDAVRDALQTGVMKDFAQRFSSSAHVIATISDNSSIMIDLYETTETHLSNMLWIAVGLPGSMPIYNYHYYHYEQIGQDLYAFLSVFSIETDDQPVFPLESTFAC